MIDKLFTDKMLTLLVRCTLLTTCLHMILGFMAGLQNTPIRNFGIAFTILGVLALICVVWASFLSPWFMPLSLLVIVVPGMLMAVLVRMVLMGFLLTLFLSPVAFFVQAIEIIFALFLL